MSPKNQLRPAPKNRIQLKRALLFGAGAIAVGAIVWKIFFTTAATVATTTNVRAMFTPGSGSVLTGHTWEATLSVDHTKVADTVNITDYPLLVQLTIPELKTTSFGGNVQSPAGLDILFAGDNHQQLDHQLELYDPTTDSITAWVRLPVLYHDVNTELIILCGDPTASVDQSTDAVWDSTYTAVWHMNNDPTISELIDYANNYDALPHSSMNSSNVVPGKIGQAIDFDGNNDDFAIRDLHYDTQGEVDELYMSAWVNTIVDHNNWTSNWAILDFDRSEKFHLSVHGSGYASFCTRNANGGIDDMFGGNAGQLNDGQWHHVATTYAGGEKKIYINGILVDTRTTQDPLIGRSSTRYGVIGDGSEANVFNGQRNNRHYDGMIDELRLGRKAHSAGRILTEYNNQSSPETFVLIHSTSTLPIELGDVNATLEGDEVMVEWEVLTQQNNDFFTIERATNGIDFREIGKVDGAGTTQNKKNYTFVDASPEVGINYYRLRQTDYDGQNEVFDPVSVKYVPEISSIEIEKAYPNPFENQFKVDFVVDRDSYVQIALVDQQGNTLDSDTRYVYEGPNTYEFFASEVLTPGMYFFNIAQEGGKKSTIKLIKR